jgi:hypothetical protein
LAFCLPSTPTFLAKESAVAAKKKTSKKPASKKKANRKVAARSGPEVVHTFQFCRLANPPYIKTRSWKTFRDGKVDQLRFHAASHDATEVEAAWFAERLVYWLMALGYSTSAQAAERIRTIARQGGKPMKDLLEAVDDHTTGGVRSE